MSSKHDTLSDAVYKVKNRLTPRLHRVMQGIVDSKLRPEMEAAEKAASERFEEVNRLIGTRLAEQGINIGPITSTSRLQIAIEPKDRARHRDWYKVVIYTSHQQLLGQNALFPTSLWPSMNIRGNGNNQYSGQISKEAPSILGVDMSDVLEEMMNLADYHQQIESNFPVWARQFEDAPKPTETMYHYSNVVKAAMTQACPHYITGDYFRRPRFTLQQAMSSELSTAFNVALHLPDEG